MGGPCCFEHLISTSNMPFAHLLPVAAPLFLVIMVLGSADGLRMGHGVAQGDAAPRLDRNARIVSVKLRDEIVNGDTRP